MLYFQDPNEKDIPAQMSSSRRNSSLNRSNSSTSGHRVVTSWKSFDDLSLPSSSIALKENVRYGKSEYCDKWNNTSVFDAFVIVLETALESYYAKAKTLAVEDRIAAKKELQKCKPLEVHLEKVSSLHSIILEQVCYVNSHAFFLYTTRNKGTRVAKYTWSFSANVAMATGSKAMVGAVFCNES